MEYINDDCLLEINKRLLLIDGIRLSQAYERFRVLVQPKWCRKYQSLDFETLLEVTQSLKLNEDDMGYLFGSIGEVIEGEMIISSPKLVKAMSAYYFPKIHTLKLDFLLNLMSNDKVEPIDLNAMFPNLCRLSISGNFDWNNSSISRGLKDFKIFLCPQFNHKHFVKILKELPLTSVTITGVRNTNMDETAAVTDLEYTYDLESLSLPYDCFPWILKMNFNNLKELHFETKNGSSSKHMINECLNKIEQITSSDTPIEMLLWGDKTALKTDANILKRVQKLTISDIARTNMSVHLPALRELTFKDFIFHKEIDFSGILAKCKNLEFINIENCVFMAPQPTINIEDLVINRTKVLKLNLWHNEYQNAALAFVGQSDLFVETNEEIEKLPRQNNCFIFELKNAFSFINTDTDDEDN